MEAQEIFDTVAKHLMRMKQRSIAKVGGCAYRGDEGAKCAVGCLITDEEYEIPGWHRLHEDHDLDNLPIGSSVEDLEQEGLLPERLRPHVALLSELQNIHDDAGMWMRHSYRNANFEIVEEPRGPDFPRMRSAFVRVAQRYDLDTTVLYDEFAQPVVS